MNCNVAWYLQSGACLPVWANIVFFAATFIVALLWADLLTFRVIARWLLHRKKVNDE